MSKMKDGTTPRPGIDSVLRSLSVSPHSSFKSWIVVTSDLPQAGGAFVAMLWFEVLKSMGSLRSRETPLYLYSCCAACGTKGRESPRQNLPS